MSPVPLFDCVIHFTPYVPLANWKLHVRIGFPFMGLCVPFQIIFNNNIQEPAPPASFTSQYHCVPVKPAFPIRLPVITQGVLLVKMPFHVIGCYIFTAPLTFCVIKETRIVFWFPIERCTPGVSL